ncbi:uncharacterized protein LOC110230896 [Arabidopsis lyrata subsp. lyrata]|uniref:uncharacterized protein LOC110230896 n=1 Tax=Arabidopsis lyrata subsp. lyrata TaxID=81972 RepID=UPI000A29BCDE|nr:uncharacterized protein LOC110230896 [Arabidopsis lyrata subsp. lyrata]|eukprot:XP_020890788.1 uncharacterized protein LOC110230896 [Arabidopsis lyrata subsp. lyrata]
MDLNLMVSSLITSQGEWNVQRLTELFPPYDVTHIRSFPPEISVADKSVWAYTKDGKYSVKSANWVLTREAELMEVIPADIQAANATKERVWKVSTAPKIRLFLWRVLSGALAIADCLRSHGLNINPMCQLCNGTNETISHIDHLLNLMEKQDLDKELREAIPWLLWEIWKARNSTLYAAKTNSPHFVVATALEEAKEWLQQNILSQQGHVQRNQRQLIGFMSCWRSLDRTESRGDAIFHARDAFIAMFNRLAAELHGILWCLRSLKDIRIESCELWSDCGAAIDALRRPEEYPKYRSQIIKIQQVIRVMREVSFYLSSPKANSLAKEIVCSVTREGRFTSYLARGGPAWLHNRIEDDRRGRR